MHLVGDDDHPRLRRIGLEPGKDADRVAGRGEGELDHDDRRHGRRRPGAGYWTSMLRGRSITVPSKAWRISSCSWKKAEPSVSIDWLIGASAERTQSLSLARTIARSMNRPSMRLGFSIASVRPRPGSRSSAERAGAEMDVEVEQGGRAAGLVAHQPGERGRDGRGADAAADADHGGHDVAASRSTVSLTRGPEMVICALAKASRSWSAMNGFSR